MKSILVSAIVAILSCGPVKSAEPEKPSVASMPPVVVKTVPQSGDMKVDPATTEIKVTFSKRMTVGQNYSWCGGGETYPQTPGKPRWLADGRTCVLPVKLEPGKTYVIGVNSQQFTAFRDARGRPSLPYLIVFETADK